MPVFAYTAMTAAGETTVGTLSAGSRSAAMDQVAAKGLMPVEIEERAEGAPGWKMPSSGRVKPAQVESFTRELANLLAGGVSLSRALHILSREASLPAPKKVWSAIHDSVVDGMSLADAMAQYPQVFPPINVAMVHAGETGGFLEVVLNQIADFQAREADLKGRVKAAMIYPIVLAVFCVAVLIFLLTYFIPQFRGIFQQFGSSLPYLTQVVVGASNIVRHYGLLVAVVIAVMVVMLRRAMASDQGRRTKERLILKSPGLGYVASRFALVRFTRMLGTLLGSGVPLVTALKTAREAIGNQTLSDAVGAAIEDVRSGASLARSLGQCPMLFPPSVVEMVAVAEETGRLDKELVRLSASYELDLDRRLRILVALLEPLMLFLMAAIIGTVVVSMLLPVFSLSDLIK